MSQYDTVVKMWQDWNIRSVDDLSLRLDNFRILFAYNSGKIENAEINYHDTREIFENGKVVGYSGSTRTLFEQQNQKVCYDLLQDKIVAKEPLSIELICTIHRALTEGTYDERRYIVNGERPGEFKKHDYVTGKNEVGSQPDEVERDLAELIEEVNAIGVEFAQKQFPDFEVIVATHIDTGHLHNHLVVNSVSCANGRKLEKYRGSCTGPLGVLNVHN